MENSERKGFLSFFKRKGVLIGGISLLVVLAVALGFLLLNPKDSDVLEEDEPVALSEMEISDADLLDFKAGEKLNRPDVKLEALQLDVTGLSIESGFRLTLPKTFDESFIEESLTITPALGYTLKKEAQSFMLIPDEKLQPNTVYSFKLKDETTGVNNSWAFQTRRDFKITSSLPGNEGTYVPLNSGIEIVFSHEGVLPLDDYFIVEPSVNGRFEYHKNTAVFVPDALMPDTIYKVTVKQGLGLQGSAMTLASDYSFQFQTEPVNKQSQDLYFYAYSDFNTFPSDIAPYFDVVTPDVYIGNEVAVSVYKYPDADRYLKEVERYNERPRWARINEEDLMPDVNALEKVAEASVKIQTTEEPWYRSFIILPETLPEGHYLFTFSMEGMTDYSLSQVNDMLLYANIGKEKSLCWLNDNITGETVAGATIEGTRFSAASTDQSGVAMLNMPLKEKDEAPYINMKITRDGHPSLIASVSTSHQGYYYDDYYYDSYRSSTKENWSYLYLDRGTYLPSDTINLWGLIKPRNGKDQFENLTLNLSGYAYHSEFGYEDAVLMTKKVEVSKYGTYTSSFHFDGLETGGYRISLQDGERILDSRYFYIETYTKPEYTISVESDVQAAMAEDPITFKIDAKFFEGTPASGLSFNYSAYGNLRDLSGNDKGTFKVNSAGQYNLLTQFAATTDLETDGMPRTEYIYIANADSEETEINQTGYIDVFPRDVVIQSNGKLEDGVAKIHIDTNEIDIKPVNQNGIQYDDEGNPNYLGKAYDTKVKVSIIENYWEKTPNGTYYDFINKVTYTRYEYEQKQKSAGQFEVETVDGKADYEFQIPNYHKDSYYEYKVDTKDSKGRALHAERYLMRQYDYYYYFNYYSNSEDDPYYHVQLDADDSSFKKNEAFTARLMKNGINFDLNPNGRVLFMILKEGIVETKVASVTTTNWVFDDKLIPNAYVYAVLFDGRNIKTTYPSSIYYDTAEEKLLIKATTDKPEYGPGDQVEVSFEVTDSAGKPQKAEVNLSVVDEAYFALYGQYVNTLNDIYSAVFDTGIESEHISYEPYREPGAAAEGGEGGDEATIRQDFKDNAIFKTIEVGNDGRGSISFKLPDNLTSWRLTYQGITADLKAGDGKLNINAKLPFFLQVIANKLYLEGDQPVILLRSFGTAQNPDEDVAYTCEIIAPNGKTSELKASGKGSELTQMKLPVLEEGNYILTIRAQNGSHKDAIRREIRVEKNILKGTMTKYYSLADGLQFEDTDAMATLTFYNRDLLTYYNMLWSLSWSWGSRVDQVLARKIAREQLKTYFQEDFFAYDDTDLLPYQQYDGGIALLTYGSSDPELSAKIASLNTDFDKGRLKNYFYEMLQNKESTPLQMAASYWGLAALHEPVLIEMNAYLESLKQDPQFTLKEKLYMALAFADIGDYETALKIYQEIMGTYQADQDSYVYLKVSDDPDENQTITSLGCLLALKLDSSEKISLFNYMLRKSTHEVLINLEKTAYMTTALPVAAKESSFVLTLDGEDEKIQLDGLQAKTIILMPGELKKVKISDTKGSPVVMISYQSPLSKLQGKQKQSISVERRYLVDGVETTQIQSTDLVTVELTVQFDRSLPEGYYEVTDVLPSGLRCVDAYVYREGEQDWYFSWANPEGQLVKLGVYNGVNRDKVIRYKARVIAPGSYTADNACVKDTQSDACGFSKRNTIQIGE